MSSSPPNRLLPSLVLVVVAGLACAAVALGSHFDPEQRLRAGDQAGISASITALDGDRDRITTTQTDVGSRQIRVEAAIQAAADNELKLSTSLSNVENADLPKVIVDLQMQQVAYQASLAATARVMQPSLLDFLR